MAAKWTRVWLVYHCAAVTYGPPSPAVALLIDC